MKRLLIVLCAVAVVVVIAVQAQAAITAITPSAFSGSESLITFSNVTDNKNGDPITVGGITFENLASGKLYSGYAYGFDRGKYFGKASDDGQFLDLISQSNFTITFGSAVNRVGMVLATGLSYPDTHPSQTWSYEAYGIDGASLGIGSVTSTTVIDINGGTKATGSVFLGFESLDEAIAQVRIYETLADATANNGQITMLDNLRFEAVSAAVPEPATILVWSLLGLTATGFGAWRRSRAA